MASIRNHSLLVIAVEVQLLNIITIDLYLTYRKLSYITRRFYLDQAEMFLSMRLVTGPCLLHKANRCQPLRCKVRSTGSTAEYIGQPSSRDMEDEYSRQANELIKSYLSNKQRSSVSIISKTDVLPRPMRYRRNGSDPLRDVVIADMFCDAKECRALCNFLRGSALSDLMLSSGERKADMSEDCLSLLGLSGSEIDLCANIHHKMKCFAEKEFNRPLRQEGSIVSWLSCMDDRDGQANRIESRFEDGNNNLYTYSNVHCDKANNSRYDISAILYLNDGFEGGQLAFLDEQSDFLIEPSAGRAVLFHSCIRNIHQVRPVLSGHRLGISVWFSVS